jgi:hypothetical protein
MAESAGDTFWFCGDEGYEFRVDPLSFKVARKVGHKLVSTMVAAQEGGLSAAIERLDDEALEWIGQECGKRTRVRAPGGQGWARLDGPMQEVVFANKLTAWMKWLRHCLELNFSDFFAELRQQKEALAAEEGHQSPSTSTGSSGG